MPNPITIESALTSIPKRLRTKLLDFYRKMKDAYRGDDYDSCGTRAGKFAEILIRCLQELLEGKHTPLGTQVNLFNEATRLGQLPKTPDNEPLRVFIPRALCFLYTIRNKRGFAHAGHDLDSHPVDAITCVRVADWCLCELIRVIHKLPLEDAQTLVNTIATKDIPEVWAVGSKKRVLNNNLDFKSKTLLLLYSDISDVILIEDLFEWTEYSRMDSYKQNVLKQLHTSRLIEWDRETDSVTISPSGIAKVENEILKPDSIK